ncbi:MAG: putative C-S lyase, partial [Candidatus Kryptoniota bacterium]
MEEDFDRIIPRHNTHSLKWDMYPQDVLPLWVADMDFRSPEAVIVALRAAVDHGIFGYPLGIHADPHEREDLRQMIVERMKNLYQWKIQTEDILFVPGVVVGFNMVVRALSD